MKSDRVLEKFVLGIFVEEIINQCEFALMSWEYLQECLMKIGDNNLYGNNRIFLHIQAFLVAVANISKILFPNKKFASRGEELRKVLQVPENSPVENKKFRNDFEHYDERIESWAISSERKIISDMNISYNGFSAISNLDPTDCMRNLDILGDRENLTLTFHGESNNLTITMHAVKELHERAKKLRPDLF